jgi:basic amino acid/polyamine antiporter, APA family
MSALRKSIGPFPLIAMGAAGIIGTSWIYTNGEFFAAYGAGARSSASRSPQSWPRS